LGDGLTRRNATLDFDAGIAVELAAFLFTRSAIDGISESDGKVLDEWFKKHAGRINRKNHDRLSLKCELIPFRVRLIEGTILFQRPKIGDNARKWLRNILLASEVICLPDISENARF